MTFPESVTDRRITRPAQLESLIFGSGGLLPVVAQDVTTGDVLMLAFANREALEATLSSGEMHYWSRARAELWRKGATSGNVQDLVSLHADCDGDAVLARVRSRGPACHTGEATCFGVLPATGIGPGAFPGTAAGTGPEEAAALPSPAAGTRPTPGEDARPGPVPPPPESTLPSLWSTLLERASQRPAGSYTVRLLDDENLRLKKIGEEAAELILALGRGERERAAEEAADLTYHLLTALLAAGVTLEHLLDALERRRR